LRDAIEAAEKAPAIAADAPRQKNGSKTAGYITPPVAGDAAASEEKKRRVLDDIEELAEDPELDEDSAEKRQLRSLKQEVLANAITPEQGEMELDAHARTLGRGKSSAVRIAEPPRTYAKSLLPGSAKAGEPASEEDAGLMWGRLLDPDGTSNLNAPPGFTDGVASLYSGPGNPAAPGFGWGAAAPQWPAPSPAAPPAFGTTTSAGKTGEPFGHLTERPRGLLDAEEDEASDLAAFEKFIRDQYGIGPDEDLHEALTQIAVEQLGLGQATTNYDPPIDITAEDLALGVGARIALFLKGLTFGLSPHLAAALSAIPGLFSEEGFGGAYHQSLEDQYALMGLVGPRESLLWEMTGAVAPAAFAGGATLPAAASRLAPAASPLSHYVQSLGPAATTGLGGGMLYGFLDGTGKLDERARNAQESGLTGLAASLLFPPAFRATPALRQGAKAIWNSTNDRQATESE